MREKLKECKSTKKNDENIIFLKSSAYLNLPFECHKYPSSVSTRTVSPSRLPALLSNLCLGSI